MNTYSKWHDKLHDVAFNIFYYLYKFEKKISCTEKVNDIQNCQDELKKCGWQEIWYQRFLLSAGRAVFLIFHMTIFP